MFSVKVELEFSAAHNLRGYKGKCEELHGHNWKVQVVAAKDKLDNSGMLIDFRLLKSALKRALDELDHRYLNKIPYFKKENPTSENIARYIFLRLKRRIPQIKEVTVWESEKCAATYDGE